MVGAKQLTFCINVLSTNFPQSKALPFTPIARLRKFQSGIWYLEQISLKGKCIAQEGHVFSGFTVKAFCLHLEKEA